MFRLLNVLDNTKILQTKVILMKICIVVFITCSIINLLTKNTYAEENTTEYTEEGLYDQIDDFIKNTGGLSSNIDSDYVEWFLSDVVGATADSTTIYDFYNQYFVEDPDYIITTDKKSEILTALQPLIIYELHYQDSYATDNDVNSLTKAIEDTVSTMQNDETENKDEQQIANDIDTSLDNKNVISDNGPDAEDPNGNFANTMGIGTSKPDETGNIEYNVVYGTGSSALENAITGADNFLNQGDNNSTFDFDNITDMLYVPLLVMGIIIAVIIGAILGIKYITSGVEGQAKIKEALVPYVIGCLVVFGAFSIWKVVVTVLNTATKA